MAVATDADVAAAVSFNRVAATSRVSSAAVAVAVAVAVAYEEAGYKGGGRRGNSKCLVVMREV